MTLQHFLDWWISLSWSASLALFILASFVLCALIYALDQWVNRVRVIPPPIDVSEATQKAFLKALRENHKQLPALLRKQAGPIHDYIDDAEVWLAENVATEFARAEGVTFVSRNGEQP